MSGILLILVFFQSIIHWGFALGVVVGSGILAGIVGRSRGIAYMRRTDPRLAERNNGPQETTPARLGVDRNGGIRLCGHRGSPIRLLPPSALRS